MDFGNNESQDIGRTKSPSYSLAPSNESSSASISENSMQSINDVVGFSLCSLSTVRLNYLYPEQFHDSFRKATIKRMIEHFGLPKKVENSVTEFVCDDEFTFLSAIKHNHEGKVFRLIEELILLAISSGSYDARMHYLIIDIAQLLGVPRDLVELHCESIYEFLLNAQYPPSSIGNYKRSTSKETSKTAEPSSDTTNNEEKQDDDDDDDESKKYCQQRDTRNRIKKYLMIGLASLGGGAVIGVTGGLAAPIVASAFGAAIGAGSFVMSSAAAGVVGSLFGVAGAGLTASKMQKRIGDLEEFAFESLNPEHDQSSLTITIAISGWITEEGSQQFLKPWQSLRHTKEQYCLRYESKYLLELSQAMDYLLSFVVSYAAQEALKYTFLAGVMAAIAWPTALISMANIIDNPWDVCVGRSAEAGKHLADVLMSRQQGRRPVSLIGFSLGARVIYFCLKELAHRPNSEGIICDVVLLGAPVTASQDQWRPLGRVISGSVINGYSSSDWLLKFLYRTSSAAIRVAGLQELCWHDRRVRNVDLTQLVSGHMDYYKKLSEILQYVNVRTLLSLEHETKLVSVSASELDEAQSAQLASSQQQQLPLDSSGIGRSISQATEISCSLSDQSLAGLPEASSKQATERAVTLGDSRIASLAPTGCAEAGGLARQQWPLATLPDNNNGEQQQRAARRKASPSSPAPISGNRRLLRAGSLRRPPLPQLESNWWLTDGHRHRTRSI